ncbi:MAG: phosphoribosylamine--glycine ligase [Clostridiales bacterium]|nr:phosphoribosylamine--glycine ligase [Clostridiales bacterium]
MKVLIIGGGGREHAIAWKLKQSPKVTKLWCAPGNGGIADIAECVPFKATDLTAALAFCMENRPDLVVVAPDDPLTLGMVDVLTENGFRAFGPNKNAALIEGSKSFAKELMKKYDIPTARYEVFDDKEKALSYIRENGAPIVIKADGLALGKGVTVAFTVEDAENAVKAAMEEKVFGNAGAKVVIEEYLTGPEVSVLCFTDGNALRLMPSAQDHKRAYDNDEGPNTGGMGAFSPSRNFTKEIEACCLETIFIPTIKAMKKEGRPFKGVLYFGLMLTKDGPKVIEYNARFGDPETQAVLMRMTSDLFEAMNAVIDERLNDIEIAFSDESACCIVMASGGYPLKYETGFPISGINNAEETGAVVFHAGTKQENGVYKTSGGRVLGVTAKGLTSEDAAKKAYQAVEKITFQDMHFRHDIG